MNFGKSLFSQTKDRERIPEISVFSLKSHTCTLHTVFRGIHLPFPHFQAVSSGWTALMWSAWYGHTEIVDMLLRIPGIRVDQLNNAGKCAVMYAAEAGRTEAAHLLLSHQVVEVSCSVSSRAGHLRYFQSLFSIQNRPALKIAFFWDKDR